MTFGRSGWRRPVVIRQRDPKRPCREQAHRSAAALLELLQGVAEFPHLAVEAVTWHPADFHDPGVAVVLSTAPDGGHAYGWTADGLRRWLDGIQGPLCWPEWQDALPRPTASRKIAHGVLWARGYALRDPRTSRTVLPQFEVRKAHALQANNAEARSRAASRRSSEKVLPA